MKNIKGRFNSLASVSFFYKKETIIIRLGNETLTVFDDGSMKHNRSISYSRGKGKRKRR